MNIIFFILIIFSSINSYSADLKNISVEEYLSINPSSEKKDIVNFITKQFDLYISTGVTQKQLDDLWREKEVRDRYYMARFQIVDQKLYAESFSITYPYFIKLLNYLQKLTQTYKINDIDFIVYVHDEILPNAREKLENKTLGVPAFLMSKDTNSIYEKDKFLIPDIFMFQKSWSQITKVIQEGNKEHLWSTKEDKIFWRGWPSGSGENKGLEHKRFGKLPRLSLVMLSALYPDLIDARFSIPMDAKFRKISPDFIKLIDLIFKDNSLRVSMVDHLQYKYLISVDGSTCAWQRVPWIMLSNSVLVKQETSKIEWFYPALKPYVNYVPVNEDLTNIFEQLDWMKKHDSEVQKISINAQNFIKNNLIPEDIDAHMVIILNEYSKIQKDNKIKATLVPYEDVLSLPELIKSFFLKLF